MKKKIKKNQKKKKKKKIMKYFRNDIQGLRGLALLLIVLAQFHIIIPIGATTIGLDILIVIAGYTITLNIYKKLMSNQYNPISILNRFYMNRFIKNSIVIMFTLILICITSFFLPADILSNHLYDPFTVLLAYTNRYYINNNIDYHLTSTSNTFQLSASPFIHFWLISLFIQYYIYWPLIIFIIYYITHKDKITFTYTLYIIIMFIILFGIYYNMKYNYNHANLKAYFSLTSRLWQFALGSYIAINDNLFYNLSLKQRLIMNLTGAIGLIMSILLLKRDFIPLSFIYMILPSISTFFLIASGINKIQQHSVQDILHASWLQILGLLSNSLYLLYWPIYIYIEHYINRLHISMDLFHQISLLVLTSLFSYILFRYIELPIRILLIKKKSKKKKNSLKKSLLYVLSYGLYHVLSFFLLYKY